MIYADNAATTKLDHDAFEAMVPYLLENFGNASQPYAFSHSAKKALANARKIIAECIGALPEEIYFTSGGTESDNWVIKGLLSRDTSSLTLTSVIEHHAILHSCATIERLGHSVKYLSVNQDGTVQPVTLRRALSTIIEAETDKIGKVSRAKPIRLVSIMLANNEIGTVEPIQELATLSHESGALFHTDAVQAVGHIPVNVKALDVDMLSASGHKFNAPKGVGFLYIKRGTQIAPYSDGGAQEQGLRAGTENIASIVAMAVALKKNCDTMAKTEARLTRMETAFLETLDTFGLNYLRNGASEHVPGNISISIKNSDGEMLLHRLDLKKICISTGSACDSQNTQVSHVIRAIGIPDNYARGTIRVSFGRDNQESDAVAVAKAIVKIIEPQSISSI